jgi:NAD(P)-dependent dehydrogenase (short-subunit alcohol dehydrogenase family)
MEGRRVLITGGNTGLGKETAVALARLGANVVFTTRDAQKGAAALTEIQARSGSQAVEVMELDLARLDSAPATSSAAALDDAAAARLWEVSEQLVS